MHDKAIGRVLVEFKVGKRCCGVRVESAGAVLGSRSQLSFFSSGAVDKAQ